MTEQTPSPKFMDEIQAAMQTPEPADTFVKHLRAALHPREQRKAVFAHFTLRPVWMAVIAVLAVVLLTTLVIGPQKVWAAFRGLFGYLPGIGLVEEGSGLRLLAEPVTQTRDGITLTVENAAFDGSRLILVYKAEGLSLEAANSQGEDAATGGVAAILLADGSVFTQVEGSGTGWATGYRLRITFSGLPPEMDSFTLFIHRLETMPEGAAPQDWQIPVKLAAAPDDLTTLPVYELPTPTPAAQPSIPQVATDGHSASMDGIEIVLEKVYETEIGYRFEGYTSWKGRPDTTYVEAYPSALRSGDVLIAYEQVSPDQPEGTSEVDRSYWAVQTNSRALSGEVSIQFTDIVIHERADTAFQLDLGASPAAGELYHPNIPLTVNQKSAVLTSAELISRSDGMSDLNLYFVADPSIRSISVYDAENYIPTSEGEGGGGGGGSTGKNSDPLANVVSSFRYGKLPTGIRSLTIMGITRSTAAPLSLTWQAPDTAAAPETPNLPGGGQICLTDSIWSGLDWNHPAGLPEAVQGTLLVEQSIAGQLMPLIYLANIDGSNHREIDYGGWSSLSPDGKMIAYIRSDGPGIVVYDSSKSSADVVPGTIPEDWNPIWSPDGEWIVFKRGVGGTYYRVHPDGSGLEMIFRTSDYLDFSSFDPDGKSIIAQGLTDQGVMVQRVDIEKQQVGNLFPTGLAKTVAYPLVSPDGGWILYRGKDFGVASFSVKLARVDGSDERVIAETPTLNTLLGAWSPDGKYVIITVHTENGDYVDRSVLIGLEDCSVYLLPDLPGQVKGWAAAEP